MNRIQLNSHGPHQKTYLNLNEKYFSISDRCGRNHENKFCLRPLKGRLGPWELTVDLRLKKLVKHPLCFHSKNLNLLMESSNGSDDGD